MAAIKPRPLPNNVLLALATYYYHRNKANAKEKAEAKKAACKVLGVSSNDITIPPAYSWDKDADLKALDATTPKWLGWSAISGTFWFTYSTKRFTVSREVNESNYLDGGKVSVDPIPKKQEKPSWLADYNPYTR